MNVIPQGASFGGSGDFEKTGLEVSPVSFVEGVVKAADEDGPVPPVFLTVVLTESSREVFSSADITGDVVDRIRVFTKEEIDAVAASLFSVEEASEGAAPFAAWGELQALDGYQWLCLLFCCLNTPIAYGAFAEALNYWEVSKVSTTITLVPLFTIVFAALGHWLQPQHFAAVDINLLAAIGAMLVVFGAICSALQQRQKLEKTRRSGP